MAEAVERELYLIIEFEKNHRSRFKENVRDVVFFPSITAGSVFITNSFSLASLDCANQHFMSEVKNLELIERVLREQKKYSLKRCRTMKGNVVFVKQFVSYRPFVVNAIQVCVFFIIV